MWAINGCVAILNCGSVTLSLIGIYLSLIRRYGLRVSYDQLGLVGSVRVS